MWIYHLQDFHPIGSRLIQLETRDSLPRPFRIRRGTQRHAGVDELRVQIARDRESAEAYFAVGK